MVAVTYGDARVPGVETVPNNATKTVSMAGRAETAAPRKHWLVRLMDAMIEARMQQARREVRMYTQLVPYTVDEHGKRQVKTETNNMPFGGW